jgi:predicted transcriptional regulator
MSNTTKRITTSIKIDPAVWKEARKFAIDKDRDVSDIVEDALKEKIEREKQK